jgi:microcystin degradation protein MlrC
MRIFAAGVASETNTFSPIPTRLEDFLVQRGTSALQYPGLDLSATWGVQARARGDEFIFSLNAWAQPSGITVESAYEALREEILADLRRVLPVDIVLLNLHGAMVAQGYDDCEEDLLRRVRALVGARTVIAAELDLHCHLSAAKLEPADIVITYKEYPHTDVNERAAELFDLAVAARLGHIRPTMALFDCRMLGLYPTSREPLRGFVRAMRAAEQRGRVLSISFGHGFQFADLPHAGAKMLVITDGDALLAHDVAAELGLQAYALRQEIGFDSLSLPMHEALSRAVTSVRGPVVVADQSDNPGAGAPSDATFALRWLVERDIADAALAFMHDPEVVRTAKRAGSGSTVQIKCGGKAGPLSGEPLDMTVKVLAAHDNYVHQFTQQSGPPVLRPAGDVAAVRCGSIDIVVSSRRCQCFTPSVFSDLGIDPRRKRLLVVKSAQHFYEGFSPIATEVIYMAAPGAVPPDPRFISYRRLDTRRLYPWNEDPLAG